MKTLAFNEQQLQKMKTKPGFIAALDHKEALIHTSNPCAGGQKMHGGFFEQ